MRKMILIFLFFAVTFAFGQTNKPGYEVVFYDDFSAPPLNHAESDFVDSKWVINNGKWWSGQYVHSTELQYYTRYDLNYSIQGPNNYIIPGHESNFIFDTRAGTLEFRLQEEYTENYIPGWMEKQSSDWIEVYNANGTLSHYKGKHDYTSGWIETPQGFKYGYFEIRCTIPNSGRVAWPAFWLYGGTENELDKCGSFGEVYDEIDIFEFTGYTSNRFTRNIHMVFDLDYYKSQYYWGYHDNYKVYYDDNKVTVSDYYEKVLGTSVGGVHTYACEWTPRKIVFYFDGLKISPTFTSRIPTAALKLTANLALPDWLAHGINSGYPGSSITFPVGMKIYNITVYKKSNEDFCFYWGNKGSNTIDKWHMASTDRYINGDFDGDEKDEVIGFSKTGYCHVMKFNGKAWTTQWYNNGSKKIHMWNMANTDRFFAGDVDGDGKDELIGISVTGYCHVMNFNGSQGFSTSWTNGGDKTIHWWHMADTDQYVCADFDGDNKAELAAFSLTGYCHVMDFNGSGGFSTQYTNGGSGKIDWWNMNPGDTYTAGDFDGDNKDELLASSSGTTYAHCMNFLGSSGWQTMYTNKGNDRISSWYLNSGDTFITGDFNNNGKDDLLAFASNGWSQLISYTGTTFQTVWNNEGLGLLHNPKHFLGGNFFAHPNAELLSIAGTKWAYIQEYIYHSKLPSRFVSIKSDNLANYYIRHQSNRGRVTTATTTLAKKEATFRLVPGLADTGCYSLESVRYPGYYLRNISYRLYLRKYDGSQAFKNDATYKMVTGLANWYGVSFESVNYPGRYIRHRNNYLYLESGTGSDFNESASFTLVDPLYQ